MKPEQISSSVASDTPSRHARTELEVDGFTPSDPLTLIEPAPVREHYRRCLIVPFPSPHGRYRVCVVPSVTSTGRRGLRPPQPTKDWAPRTSYVPAATPATEEVWPNTLTDWHVPLAQ